jgi:hypothetical protein
MQILTPATSGEPARRVPMAVVAEVAEAIAHRCERQQRQQLDAAGLS